MIPAGVFLVAVMALSDAPAPSAQEAVRASPTIRGVVRDSVTGEPLAGLQVRLGDAVVATDVEGVFEIARGMPPFTLWITRSGVAPLSRTLSETETLGTVVVLIDGPLRRVERVEVTDTRATDPSPSIPVRPRQVLQVAGAVDNIFRALQTLPGISATDEFGSRLAVRGGTPDQNLTIMDGIEIHNPYRLFGLTSAFNPETIESFEISTGAFPAKYGDRLSSILLVENRDGVSERAFQGSTTLSVTDGNVVIEGPWKNRDRGSWLVTLRRTYYDLVAEPLIDQDLPGFQDLQFRASRDISSKTRLTAFGVRSREGGDVRFEEGIEYGDLITTAKNDVFGLKTFTVFGPRLSTTLAAAAYGFEQTLRIDAKFEDSARRSNGRTNETLINIDFDQTTITRDLSVRNDWNVVASSRTLVEAGFEAHRLSTGATYEIRGERNYAEANASSNRGGASLPDFYDERMRSSRFGAYAQSRTALDGRFSFEAGLRLSHSSISKSFNLEPRLSALLRASATSRFRAAFGVHSQSPGIEKLLQSDYFLDLSQLGLENERARHFTLAFEKDVQGVSFKTEAYWKSFDDLIVGALESDAALADRLARYDFPASLASSIERGPLITTSPVNGASGRSYGIEFVLNRPKTSSRRLSGWASYTFGRAVRKAYGRELPFEYDRRHSVSLSGLWNASSKIDVGFTIRASSGFPRTRPIGVRVVAEEDRADRDRDANTTELVPQLDGVGLPVYTADFGSVSNLLGARYPAFARLDLRFNWRPHAEKSRWLFYLEFINATNRRNVGQYEARLRPDRGGTQPRIEEVKAASIPFLPTLGIRFRF